MNCTPYRIAALVVFVTITAAAADAQDLEYTTTTTIGSAGPLAAMLNMAGGGGQNVSARAFLKGAKLRVDFGTASSIIDADQQQITMLDHARRTYATSPFAAARPAVSDSILKATPVALAVAATREHTRINGVNARRTNIVARVPARNPKAPKATDLVVVMEMWTSNDNGIGTAYDRVAMAADQFGSSASALLAMLSQNPRVSAAMKQAADAAVKVTGLPVRRIATYGNIPVGSKFVPGMPLDTVMSTTTDIVDVKNAALPLSLFSVPRGYTVSR